MSHDRLESGDLPLIDDLPSPMPGAHPSGLTNEIRVLKGTGRSRATCGRI
jgi:hypothetical protein